VASRVALDLPYRAMHSAPYRLIRMVIEMAISPLLYNFILNPSMEASSNSFRRGSRGWGMYIHRNHDA
jgi:hypothetical protein